MIRSSVDSKPFGYLLIRLFSVQFYTVFGENKIAGFKTIFEAFATVDTNCLKALLAAFQGSYSHRFAFVQSLSSDFKTNT